MSGFGKRPSVSAPVGPARSGATFPDAVASERLPFSFLGLLGGAAISAAMFLSLFYGFRATMLAVLAASPEAAELGPDVFKLAARIWWWTFFMAGIFIAVPCCVVTHWIAYFLRRSDLWLFALLGLAFVLALALFGFASRSVPEVAKILWFEYVVSTVMGLLVGPATTSIYWLIATWRVA